MKSIITLLLFIITSYYAPKVIAANQALQNTSQTSVSTTEEQKAMIERVYEIRDMHFGKLTIEQKQQLKFELLRIKNKLSDPDFTGLYLSSGVIIIILIILLVLALGKR